MLTSTAIILFNDKERKVAEGVIHRMVKRAVEMEGTVTGEHGVGLIKRDYLEHEVGESTVDTMRRVSPAKFPVLASFLLLKSYPP
jgi:D-lactate dehydrogenase (cytochrome)